MVLKPGKTKATTEDKNTEKEYQDFYVDYVIKTVCKDLMSKYGYTYRQAMEKIIAYDSSIFCATPMFRNSSNIIFKQNRFR